MTRVVDASVACKWFFEEALSDRALALATAQPTLIAPDLIVAECTNVAWRKVRNEQVSIEHAEAAIKTLPTWFEHLIPSAELHRPAFRIAHQLNHPVYDCLYIALAAQCAIPLITADAALVKRLRGTPWAHLAETLDG